PHIALRRLAQAGGMDAHPAQHARGTYATLTLVAVDADLTLTLPAGPGRRPGIVRASRDELTQRLALGLPDLREHIAEPVSKQRLEEFLHPAGEQRVAAVILVRLTDGNERWTERALPALRHDDFARAGKIGGDTADERELEPTRSHSRLDEHALI